MTMGLACPVHRGVDLRAVGRDGEWGEGWDWCISCSLAVLSDHVTLLRAKFKGYDADMVGLLFPRTRAPLDEARVLDAAFRVLEAQGFAGLTIRRIADDLGVKNPALYWHFKNKQEIVNGMAARLLDGMRDAPIDTSDWRAWLRGAPRAWYRKTLLERRDGAELLSNANLSRSRHFAEFERGIAFLAGQGFSGDDAMLGMVTVFDYALGVTYEHQADARITPMDNARCRGCRVRALAGIAAPRRRARGAVRGWPRPHPRRPGAALQLEPRSCPLGIDGRHHPDRRRDQHCVTFCVGRVGRADRRRGPLDRLRRLAVDRPARRSDLERTLHGRIETTTGRDVEIDIDRTHDDLGEAGLAQNVEHPRLAREGEGTGRVGRRVSAGRGTNL